MKAVVIGKSGQLAWELQHSVPAPVQMTALGSADTDITDADAIARRLDELRPNVVINCAAYTAVDKAESEAELAYKVNEVGVRNVALACRAVGARMLHVSTDFVFDGGKTTPYAPADATAPLSVYGASKLAGERAVTEVLPESVIVRTAWVYAAHGNNFVKSMLRLMAEKPQLNVVYDQVGSPTWARGLAAWLWSVAQKPDVSGTFHWTDAGVASWYDFAVAVQELGIEKGLLKQEIPITAIPSSQYPTPAKRPAFSVLDKTSAQEAAGLSVVHWRKQLSAMMDGLL